MHEVIERWHLDLAAIAIVAGLVAVGLTWRTPRARVLAGSAAGMAVLAWDGRAGLAAVLGAITILAAATLAPRLDRRQALGIQVAGAAALVVDLWSASREVFWLVGPCVLLVALVSEPAPTDDGSQAGSISWVALAAYAVAAAALWACVPDTEPVLAIGAATVVAATSAVLGSGARPTGATFAVLLWAGGAGLAGRPGGAGAVWVIATSVVVLAVVRRSRQRAGRWPPSRPPVVPLAALGVLALVAARTVGLSSSLSTSLPLTLVLAGAAALTAVACSRSS